MPKKFTTEKQFWTALSEQSQALIVKDLAHLLPQQIDTDPDYQEILKNYQASYYAEQTLSESEPMIKLLTRDYLVAIQERIKQYLAHYYEEN